MGRRRGEVVERGGEIGDVDGRTGRREMRRSNRGRGEEGGVRWRNREERE